MSSENETQEVVQGKPADIAKRIIDQEFVDGKSELILSVGGEGDEGKCALFTHASAAFKMELVAQLVSLVVKDNGDMPRRLVGLFVMKTVSDAVKAAIEDGEPQKPEPEPEKVSVPM